MIFEILFVDGQTLNQFWTKNKTNFITNLIYCQK